MLKLALPLALVTLLTAVHSNLVYAAGIDATKGRQYKLTKRHGPWMIMVATFSEPPEERRGKGLSPAEAADTLVYELRLKGIPAYAFAQQETLEEQNALSRKGRQSRNVYRSQHSAISVLAGNYSTADSTVAQKTLAYIKKFEPEFLSEIEASNPKYQKFKSGGLFRRTPGRPGPLSGAFLTRNPLLSSEEFAAKETDPLVLQLNSGVESDISLLHCPHKYTVVVASFYGSSLTSIDASGGEIDEKFKAIQKKSEERGSLYTAGYQAWLLARALRNSPRKISAWVYHDRYRSIVTVGGFDSPNDPQIAKVMYVFGAKYKEKPLPVGRDGKPIRPAPGAALDKVLVAETFTIPEVIKPNEKVQHAWLFDPTPRLMLVPRIGKD